MAQMYNDLYQNWADEVDLDWFKIMEMVRNPQRHDSKDTMPLWSFYHVSDKAEQTWAGPRAVGSSMEYLVAIMVDYDDGVVQLVHVEHMFDFQFVAYSSPTSSPEKSKFRMVIPLGEPLPNKYLKCKEVREYLMSLFPYCDTSTFDYFRRQRIPCVLDSTNYKYVEKGGDRIKLDHKLMKSLYEAWVERSKKVAPKATKTGSIFDKNIGQLEERDYLANLKNKYIKELKELNVYVRGGGVVHNTLRRIVYSLRMAEVSQDEVLEFMDKYTTGGLTNEIEQLVYGNIDQ